MQGRGGTGSRRAVRRIGGRCRGRTGGPARILGQTPHAGGCAGGGLSFGRLRFFDHREPDAAVRRQRIPTPVLNKFLEGVTAANPPVSPGRKHVRIMYAAQIGTMPPSFVLFTNVATTFHFSYERFLINKLREQFGFVGTPIWIKVRAR